MKKLLVVLVFNLIIQAAPATQSHKADRVVVMKSERKLLLLDGNQVLKTYKISLGGQPMGAKTKQGDHKTPEGNYVVDQRNAHSNFHKALHLSYPNPDDRIRAAKLGTSPGGDIMIHGLPNGKGWLGKTHLLYDWTDGCIAVIDNEIDEIWDFVPKGTPVEIKP